MAKAKTSKAEVSFALSFLKYAGVRNPQGNAYLLLAVIAWLRQESGGLGRVIGNNPFNIRSSPFASGYRTSRGNGKFAIFKSLDAGARATIALLKSDGANGWRGYGRIMRTLRMGTGGSAEQQRDQAIQFLTAVALSRWDAAHYGSMVGQDIGTYDGRKNHLIQVWSRLLGAPVILPAPKAAKPKVVEPPQPRITFYRQPQFARLEPYAAFRLLKERTQADKPLTGGLV